MNKKLRFMLTLFMVFSVIPFFAEGGAEILSLAEIDTLIKDTNYDQALEQLHLYILEYPEQFDEAQKRIKKVMGARNRYTVLANSLIDVIQNEPTNDEKILSITNQLEALEKHPTEKQLAFIRDAKVAAQFNYYRSKFTEIMKSSGTLTHQGDFSGSVDMVRSGFYMYQDDFFDQNISRSIVESVRASLEQIDRELALYKMLQVRLNDAVNAFIRAVRTKDTVQAENAFKNVQTVYTEYADIRNTTCSAGWRLQSVFDEMKKTNPELTDASFLPFMQRFLFGTSSIPDAGIIVAMDYEWNMFTEHMKTEIYSVMSGRADSFEKTVSGDIFAGSVVPSGMPLDSLIKFASLGNSVEGLYALLKTKDGGTLSDSSSAFSVSVDYAAALSNQIIGLLSNSGTLLAVRKKAQALSVPSDPAGAELHGNPYASGLVSAASELEKYAAADDNVLFSAEWAVPYVRLKNGQNVQNTGEQVLVWDSLENAYRKLNEYTSSFVKTTATVFWEQTALYYAACGAAYAAARRSDLAALQKLYNGTLNKTTGLVSKYPQESLNFVQEFRKNITADRGILVKAQGILSGGKYTEAYMPSAQSVSDSIGVLDSISVTITAIEADAAEQVRLAKRAQNEADLRFSQARTALSANDFDTARKRLQESRTKYNESLSYQESSSLRADTDTILASLGEEISKKQNEVIVRQVRTLKTRARTEYYNGNFDGAESLLTQAKTLWALTNVDNDEEIMNLLALVSTALSMKTGRIIPPTAPLYPEMSQILSIAQQYFKQGSDLTKQGNHEEGAAVLRQALQKLQELQLVYPLNQDASLLTLRIQKILNPDGFNDLFAKRVETARENYKITGKQQSSYTDLLDLYAIDPSYPGLRQLIYNVEIELGIRQKPVDRTALNKSVILTSEAQHIVDKAGRDEVKLQSALAKIDEAIRLNPDNDDAMLLKDRIQMSIGGKAAVVLSSEDEAKYQLAITELQNNNIVTANSLVEQLLQKPSNKRSSKILDLQKKIKALL
jgi:hypothetical protein